MNKRMTKEQFIKKAREIHGNKYDYSLVQYKNNKTKVKIICPIHGIFLQSANVHLSNHGCLDCSNDEKTWTKNDFIKKSKDVHDNMYDYSLVEYKSAKMKVKIICQKHGVFEQEAYAHIRGQGCPKCANEKISKNNSSNTEEFILKAMKIHNGRYNYDLVDYKNQYDKVLIKCAIHGIFEQKPSTHLQGCGCPLCSRSKGELIIKDYLDSINIKYDEQKHFSGCKNIYTLPFDFYIPLFNTCIEFDGRQHFETIDIWGGLEYLEKIKYNDNIKNEYCIKNNIKLIRINYNENIISKLSELL